MKGQKWILVQHFQGPPKEGDMELVEFDIPEIYRYGHFWNPIISVLF